MKHETKELLERRIHEELQALETYAPETDEHGKVVDNVVKLYKLSSDDTKTAMENTEKQERREMEAERFARDLEYRKEELQYKHDQLTEQKMEHNCDTDFRTKELQYKESQTEQQKLVDYIKLGVEIAGIVLPLMFYGRWMAKGFEFEKTGTFSSDTFRGLFMKFRPAKK